MKAMRGLAVLAMLLLAAAHAMAIPVPVPSDVAVTLTATPSSSLVPGQPIDFTLTVTNSGPMPVNRVQIASSDIYDDQIDLSTMRTDCQAMILTVVDTLTSYFYYLSWYPTDVSVLAVGETRSCHLRFALNSAAPAILPFSFGLPSYYVDINPDNDIGTVVLQRVVATVPALSPAILALLAGLLASVATVIGRRRRIRNPIPLAASVPIQIA